MERITDVAWRFYSQYKQVTRDERMRTVQVPSRETEPTPPSTSVTMEQYYDWFIRFIVIGYIVGACYGLLRRDEYRLHVFHMGLRACQFVARYAGFWALQAEQAYNDTANTIH